MYSPLVAVPCEKSLKIPSRVMRDGEPRRVGDRFFRYPELGKNIKYILELGLGKLVFSLLGLALRDLFFTRSILLLGRLRLDRSTARYIYRDNKI
jgi:hypothetical protein